MGAFKKKRIDFISLDIEGAEIDFLKCFPFDRYEVKAWAIEVNKRNNEMRIDAIMYHFGYVKIKYMNFWGNSLDALYVPNEKEYEIPYENPEYWLRHETCN